MAGMRMRMELRIFIPALKLSLSILNLTILNLTILNLTIIAFCLSASAKTNEKSAQDNTAQAPSTITDRDLVIEMYKRIKFAEENLARTGPLVEEERAKLQQIQANQIIQVGLDLIHPGQNGAGLLNSSEKMEVTHLLFGSATAPIDAIVGPTGYNESGHLVYSVVLLDGHHNMLGLLASDRAQKIATQIQQNKNSDDPNRHDMSDSLLQAHLRITKVFRNMNPDQFWRAVHKEKLAWLEAPDSRIVSSKDGEGEEKGKRKGRKNIRVADTDSSQVTPLDAVENLEMQILRGLTSDDGRRVGEPPHKFSELINNDNRSLASQVGAKFAFIQNPSSDAKGDKSPEFILKSAGSNRGKTKLVWAKMMNGDHKAPNFVEFSVIASLFLKASAELGYPLVAKRSPPTDIEMAIMRWALLRDKVTNENSNLKNVYIFTKDLPNPPNHKKLRQHMANIAKGPDGQTPESLREEFERFDISIQKLKLRLALQKDSERLSKMTAKPKEKNGHSSASGRSLTCWALIR
jgi:hypothetical protein